MARTWALCWVCGLLAASQAWSAAPPTPMDMRQVRIDLVLAKARRGAVAKEQLDSPEAVGKLARRLLEGRGVDGVELLSRPCMVMLNGQWGQCATGQDVPVEYRDAEGVVRVKHYTVGIGTRLVPTLLADGRIRVEVEPTVSFLRANNPHPHTVRVHATKDVKNGEACAVVSPPYKDDVTTVTAIPWLCELPGVGPLFRARTRSEEEFQLVTLFTAREFRPGQDDDSLSSAWPVTPAAKPQVQLDIVVARAPRGEFASTRVDEAGLRDHRRRLEKGVRERRVKIEGEPRLVTLSGNPASFLAGGERPVEHRDAAGRREVRFEVIGTRVSALPTVRDGGRIYLELEAESSQLCGKEGHLATSRTHTATELKPSETCVLVIPACGEPGEEECDLVVLCAPAVVQPPRE
jgi:Flp pilus assembly secretin CpaC